MFSELQQVTITDLNETDRIINAPTSASRGGSSYSAVRAGSAVSEEVQQLRHKMEVSDAIMRRLHKKNQELVSQIEKYRKDGVQPTALGETSLSPLKREIERKDTEIRALRETLSGAAPGGSKPVHGSRLSGLRDARLQKLQSEFNEMLEVKLEFISQGESTGKSIKKSKHFFKP